MHSPCFQFPEYMRVCNQLHGNALDFILDGTSTEMDVVSPSELRND